MSYNLCLCKRYVCTTLISNGMRERERGGWGGGGGGGGAGEQGG